MAEAKIKQLEKELQDTIKEQSSKLSKASETITKLKSESDNA